MKLNSLCAVAIASLATSFAFADQGDVVVTFSTPGIDAYADGSTVKNGEWYALCWSSDGVFEGLKTDGTPVDAKDEVILAAPLAKDGKCPSVAFQFPRKDAYKSGKFDVLLLDTRDSNGNPAKTRADVFVKNGTVASSLVKGGGMSGDATATQAAGGASVAWVAPTTLGQAQIDKVVGATIKSFKVEGANVLITVDAASTAASAVVIRTGEAVDKMNTFELPAVDASASGETTIIISKDKGKFFAAGTLAK